MMLSKWQVVLLKNGIFGPVVTIAERGFLELLPLNEVEFDEYPFEDTDIVKVLQPGEWELLLDTQLDRSAFNVSVVNMELDPLIIFEVL